MKRFTIIQFIFILFFSINVQPYLAAQDIEADDVYNYNWKIDVPITVAFAGLTAFGFNKIGQKPESDLSEVANLSEEDLWSINRSAIHPYDQKWDDRSNIFFYGAFPYPFLLLIDEDIRQDAFSYIGLYLETLAITGASYSLTAAFVDKYRPYVYSDGTSEAKKKGNGGRNSFYGGHPSLTASATFFAAKVYSDYHPESSFKYVLYGVAAGTTLANAYYRWRGGFHFPTDIAIGVTLGTLYGIGIPALHKNKVLGNDMSLVPFAGEYKGLAVGYRF